MHHFLTKSQTTQQDVTGEPTTVKGEKFLLKF